MRRGGWLGGGHSVGTRRPKPGRSPPRDAGRGHIRPRGARRPTPRTTPNRRRRGYGGRCRRRRCPGTTVMNVSSTTAPPVTGESATPARLDSSFSGIEPDRKEQRVAGDDLAPSRPRARALVDPGRDDGRQPVPAADLDDRVATAPEGCRSPSGTGGRCAPARRPRA